MTRVDARRRCSHGVPVRDYCAECVPPKPPAAAVTSLADARVALPVLELNLPPLGPHVAAICRAKGRWVVTCGCGWFRVRSDDRHVIESAWGRHRHA